MYSIRAQFAVLHQLFPTQQQLLKRRQNLPTSILERFFNEEAADKPVWKNSNHLYLFLEQPNTPTKILAELANVDLEALTAEILTKSNSSPIIKTLETWVQDETRFSDRTYYNISFWDVGYTYEVGQTPAGDWLGVRSTSKFEYNP